MQNIDRIMRLPGTTNIPDAKKRDAGRVRRAAKIIFQNERRYTVDEFEREIAQAAASADLEPDAELDIREAFDAIDLDSARAVTSLDDLSTGLRARSRLVSSIERPVGG